MIKNCKKYLHLSWLFATRLLAEKRRWQTVAHSTNSFLRVYYGHDVIPSRVERSGGAIIKLQDLDDAFTNALRGANILYLVSSAMPIFASVMVKEAKRHGVKFVLNQNGVAYPAWHGPGWEKTNKPMKFLLEQADHIVYQSDFCKKSADRFLGPCTVPYSILHNPVDTDVFTPSPVKPLGLRILLAGSHQHFYRVSTAIEMMKYLQDNAPEATLTIAGRYTWRESEKECIDQAYSLARELGVVDRIEFRGGYSQEEAVTLFQEHHLLLHTKYNDPCPRLVVEAMACGLPVVYSASGGVSELLGETAGVGVSTVIDWDKDHPPSSRELAKSTLQIRNSLDRYSTEARLRAVERLDVKPWVERHKKIFMELLDSK